MAASKSLNSEDKDFLVMMEAAFQKRNKKTDIILNLLKTKNVLFGSHEYKIKTYTVIS